MNIFISILMLLISILVVLLIHELGHFLFALLFNVNIKEFSIGVGPIIWKKIFYKSGIQFSFRMFPIAAYVSLDSLQVREIIKEYPGERNYELWMKPKKRGKFFLEETTYWKVIIVVLAGVLFNFVFFSLFFPILILISPGFSLFYHLRQIFLNIGNSLCFGQLIIVDRPTDIFTNLVSYQQILTYIILLNLSVGILNILPLPLFDGNKLFIFTYEKIAHKKVSQKFNIITSSIGIFILIWLMIGEIVVFSL